MDDRTGRTHPHRRRLLIGAFLVAGSATLLFGGKAVLTAIRFAGRENEPVKPWMTVGYVARTRHLPPDRLLAELGLDRGDRRPIADIAASRDVDPLDMAGQVAEAADRLRQAEGTP